MRSQRLLGALGSVVAAFVLLPGSLSPNSAASPSAPLPLKAPEPTFPGSLLGFAYGPSGTRLARIDPRTLRVLPGRSVRFSGMTAWAASADRTRLAVASCGSDRCTGVLRVLAMPGMRPLARALRVGSTIQALAWSGRRRLLALVGNAMPGTLRLVVIDPTALRVLSRIQIEGTVLRFARARSGFVLLTGPKNAIGTASLVVATANGTHAVSLTAIDAGYVPGGVRNAAVSEDRLPGLAIAADSGRAFVVDPGGTVATVALSTLAVSYHRPVAARSLSSRLAAWLDPAAEAKGDNGPWRTAHWLGRGLLAVTGIDWNAVISPDRSELESLTARPAGLTIVDTRHWKLTTLDPEADSFAITDGLLLATGTLWDVTRTENRTTGEGLVAYDAQSKQRFRLFAGRAVSVNRVFAGRAYLTVVVDPAGYVRQRVVDLRPGLVLRARVFDWPELLVGDGGPTS